MATDLKTLREVAERATPGPWFWAMTKSDEHTSLMRSGSGDYIICPQAEIGDYGLSVTQWNDVSPSDAAHIAAFDPPTVLALIDEVERLRAENVDLQSQIGGYCGMYSTFGLLQAERDRLREQLELAERTRADDTHTLAEMATRIGVLEEALRPFAVWWQRFGPDMTDRSAHAMFARAADAMGMTRKEDSEDKR